MRLRARAEHRGARWRAWCPPTVLGASRLRGRARDLLLRHPERGILRPRLLRHVAHRRIEPEAVRLLAEEPLRRELLQRCALLGREPLRGLVVRRPHVVEMGVRLDGREHEEDRPGGARDELVHPVARLRLRALRRHAVRLRRRFEIRDRKSTRLNSSHSQISYAVFCLKKKNTTLTSVTSGNNT